MDGSLEAISASTDEPVSTGSSQDVQIGVHAVGQRYFHGEIGDVRIYSRALSGSEIQELADKKPKMAAHWKLDGDCADATGNHDGTAENAPAYSEGIIGDTINLNGINQYIEVTGYKGISGSSSRTCGAWIKTINTNGEIISWGPDTTGNKWIVRVNDTGELRAEVGSGYVYGTSLINDGRWHHIAVTLLNDGSPDISEAKLYVDGRLDTIKASSPRAVNTGDSIDVRIGVHYSLLRYFNGSIDDVRIYNYVLTDSDVQSIYHSRFNDGGGVNLPFS